MKHKECTYEKDCVDFITKQRVVPLFSDLGWQCEATQTPGRRSCSVGPLRILCIAEMKKEIENKLANNLEGSSKNFGMAAMPFLCSDLFFYQNYHTIEM